MKNGFTMIELVVSAGIMAVLSVTLVSVLANTYQASNRITAVADVEEQGSWIIGQLKQIAPLAQSKNLICVPGDMGTSFQMINVLDGEQTTINCDSSGQKIASRSASRADDVDWVNGLNVNCDNFATCEGEVGGRVNAVKFSFTLSKQAVGQTVSREFNTRILLRN